MKAAVLMLVTATLAAQGYERVGEQAGVVVYRKPGHAIELLAEGDIAAPPAVVERVLLDYPSHPKWVHGLRVSRVLDREKNALDVYQRLDLPVLSDRDFALHVDWSEQGTTRVIRFHTVNGKAPPPPDGVVRVPLHQGSWRLIPAEGNTRTHAVYQFEMELGGKVPKWLIRGRASKDVPALFEGIRQQVRYYR